MNKAIIIKKILENLKEQAENLARGAKKAHEYATHSESKSEDKFDTRGLEASYLAEGQSRLAAEMQHSIHVYQNLIFKNFTTKDKIALTALVELDADGERVIYFIGPKNGGISIEYDGKKILVITPTSPLGQELMGKEEGDYFEMTVKNMKYEYEIISVK
jgi:transcription elongation GreA/GreB family factor